MTNDSTSKLARTASKIGAATLLSRVLGVVRELLFAALLGASAFADAFIVAFRIPNLLRDLFAEGALSQAFVPTFKKSLKHDGQQSAYALANTVLSTLVVIMILVVATAVIFAPNIVAVIASGFTADPQKFELTVFLTRIMLPFIAFVSAASVFMGTLNAQDKYTAPSLAPAVFNLVAISVGLGLWITAATSRVAVIGWSIGTLIGGFAQMAIQIPSLIRLGYKFSIRVDILFHDKNLRRIAKLMAPAVIGVAAMQLNVFINTVFASSEPGAVSWLNYGFRLLQLPIGVFGVAIATVATTRYSDFAADHNTEQMAEQCHKGLRLVVFITTPALVGLYVLAKPVVSLLFERGAFSSVDTLATAAALQMYVIGLVAYSSVKVCAPAFYAVNKSHVPMVASLTAVATNIIINVAFHSQYGYKVLALGTSLAAIVNFSILYVCFQKYVAKTRSVSLVIYTVTVILCALLMGIATYGVLRGTTALVPNIGFFSKALRALLPITIGATLYVLLTSIAKIPEGKTLLFALQKRAGRKSKNKLN